MVMALREHSLSDGAALERLEQDLLPEWERQVTQLSWAQPPAGAWEQRGLATRYASARRDAVKALAQAVQTHDTAWIDQANALQAQAETDSASDPSAGLRRSSAQVLSSGR